MPEVLVKNQYDFELSKFEYFLASKVKKIHIEWIHYFVVLSETENFTEASRILNITQQALSKAVSTIEERLGAVLINRFKNRNFLTPEGRIFLEKGKKIIFNFNEMAESFNKNENNPLRKEKIIKKEIKIAYSGIWSPKYVANYIKIYLRVFPEWLPKITVHDDKEIEKELISGREDLAFSLLKPDNEDLCFVKVAKSNFVIVGAPQPVKKWQELEFIAIGKEKGKNSDKWEEKLYPRKIIAYTDNLCMAMELCETGLGALYIPELTIREKLEKKELEIIAKSPIKDTLEVYLIWAKKNKSINNIVRLLK